MKTIKGSYDVDDLAVALATLAADILECPVDEVDLTLEAPSPLGPATLRLGWTTVSADDAADDAAADNPADNAGDQPSPGDRAVAGDASSSKRNGKHEPARPRQDRDEARRPERREDGRGGRDDGPTAAELDEEAEAAADFLEGLLDAMDLPGDLRIDVHDGIIEIEVVDLESGSLIGRRGQTLESIQEMLRASMQRQFQRRSRVVVDVEGYRRRRLEKFLEQAEEAIQDVLDGGGAVKLEPMDVYERKQVHQLVATHEGLVSRSHGREPSRRVVIEPA